MFVMLVPVYGQASSYKLKDIVDNAPVRFTPDEFVRIYKVHKDYVMKRDLSMTDDICLNDVVFRVRILDLDVRSPILEYYIGCLCPNMENGWRKRAEARLWQQKDFPMGDYMRAKKQIRIKNLTDGDIVGFVKRAGNKANRVAANSFKTVGQVVQTTSDGINYVNQELERVKVPLANLATKTIRATSEAAKTAIDESSSIGNSVAIEAGELYNQVKALPKPSKVVSAVSASLPNTVDVTKKVMDAQKEIGKDAITGLSKVYSDVKEAFRSYERCRGHGYGAWFYHHIIIDKQCDPILDTESSDSDSTLGNISDGYVDSTKSSGFDDKFLAWLKGERDKFKESVDEAPSMKEYYGKLPNVTQTVGKTVGSFVNGLLSGVGFDGKDADNPLMLLFGGNSSARAEIAAEKERHRAEMLEIKNPKRTWFEEIEYLMDVADPMDFMEIMVCLLGVIVVIVRAKVKLWD